MHTHTYINVYSTVLKEREGGGFSILINLEVFIQIGNIDIVTGKVYLRPGA